MTDTSNRTAWRIFFLIMGVMIVVLGAETWALASMHNQLDSIRRQQVVAELERPGLMHNHWVKTLNHLFGHTSGNEHAVAQPVRVEPVEQPTWDAWEDMARRQQQMEHTFANLFERLGRVPMVASFDTLGWAEPRIELKEDANRYIVSAEIPGASESDVDVSVHSRQLTISGTRSREEQQSRPDGAILWTERRMGHFERTVTLPGPVDESGMSVNIQNGVVEVTLPKAAV